MAQGWFNSDVVLSLSEPEWHALVRSLKMRYVQLWERRDALSVDERADGHHIYNILYALNYDVNSLPYPDLVIRG